MTTEERLLKDVMASKMRSRVTILIPSGSTDSYGNERITYKEGSTVWAYVENHASEMYETTAESHIIRKVLIVIRYRSDLMPESRFRVRGSVCKCLGTPVDACGRHKLTYMECVAEDTNL